MLAFLTTDATINAETLQQALRKAADDSFNLMTVDGDTSTNDLVTIMANGNSGLDEIIDLNSAAGQIFYDALLMVCKELAKMIARDGEGATKLVTVICSEAKTREDAVKVAKKIATSLLVKTALFGNDPNWGRLVMALGNAEAEYDPDNLTVALGPHLLVKGQEPQAFDEAEVSKYLAQKEIEIIINLATGSESVEVYTCDLSYDYVKINAEYHT